MSPYTHTVHAHTTHVQVLSCCVVFCLHLVCLLNVLMFITHAIHITTVLVLSCKVSPHCTSHAPQCMFYMLHLSTHTLLHVCSVLHVLFVCLNHAAHTPRLHVHASHLHTLVICCLLHNKKQKGSSLVQAFHMRTQQPPFQ